MWELLWLVLRRLALAQVANGLGDLVYPLSKPLGSPRLWGPHLPVWEEMPIGLLVVLDGKYLRDN